MAIDELRKIKNVPVVIANQEGIITYINEAFETQFGWKKSDLIGSPLTTIIPPFYWDAHHLGFSHFLQTETPTLLNKPLRLKIVTKQGEEIDAEHCITAEKNDEGWVFGATIVPR